MRFLLYLVPLVLAIYALVDCLQTEDARVRGIPKIAWIILIVLIWILGPLAWLIAGKDRRGQGTGGPAWRLGRTPPASQGQRPRTVAPDDDPEFLRQIGQRNDEQERMLREWEDDFRKREPEPRDNDEQPGDDPRPGT